MLLDGPPVDIDLSLRGDHLDGLQDLTGTAPQAAVPSPDGRPPCGSGSTCSSPGSTVLAPLSGEVERDVSGAVVLRHDPPGAPAFWIRWTGLRDRPSEGT